MIKVLVEVKVLSTFSLKASEFKALLFNIYLLNMLTVFIIREVILKSKNDQND